MVNDPYLVLTDGRGLNEVGNGDVEAVEEVAERASTEGIAELLCLLVGEVFVAEVSHPLVRRQIRTNLVQLERRRRRNSMKLIVKSRNF